jgi:hypothetical protein
MGVVFLFLLAAVAGTLTTLYWIPEEDLGRGYFQMNALVVLCFLGLAGALWLFSSLEPYGAGAGHEAGTAGFAFALAGAFGYYAAVWRQRWLAGRWAVSVALAGSLAALLAAGLALAPPSALPHRDPLLGAALLGSALLIGWSLVTMLLGHWYLVAPRLTFRHLVVFCWVLLGAVVLRTALVAGGLLEAYRLGGEAEPTPWHRLTGFAGEGPFFWFRLLWGLAIPIALALMSLHCARRRANQSATGILYVLVVGVLIGEITALYLTLTTGVPV